MSIIEDGAGTGVKAKVTSDNHLEVVARTLDLAASQAFEGTAYNFNTGTIALTTTASENGLIYFKNTGDNLIVITGFFYLFGNVTSDGDWLARVYRNPTAGTLISAGTSATPANRDFSSPATATGTFNTGADAKTITDGTVAIESILPGKGRYAVLVGAIIVGKGNSVAVTIKPPDAGNVQVAIAFYEKTLEK